jgi:proteasome accessory factor B
MKIRSRGKRSGGFSRPPLARMLYIHKAIQSGRCPNASVLAAELEISAKSIYRDIEFMRDRLDLPIEYDDRRFGYCYTQEVGAFPSLQISEGELVALLVAEKALQQYRGTSFEKPLTSAFRKIAASLPDTISVSFADWDQTISFRTSAKPVLNLEVFDVLARATVQRQQLVLQYRKPGRIPAEQRVVDPYHLANINGEWFLFGFCHLRQDIRTFVPSRIQMARTTGRTFERPQHFSVDQLLKHSFGVHSGGGEYEVVIAFPARAADYIREKRWHATQQIRELASGGVELRLRLSDLSEVQRWILSWSGDAVALHPPELVAAVRISAQAILHGLDTK